MFIYIYIYIHGLPPVPADMCRPKVSMHRPKAVMPWLHHKLFAWKTVAIAIEDWKTGRPWCRWIPWIPVVNEDVDVPRNAPKWP